MPGYRKGFSRAETAGLVTGAAFDNIPSLGHIPKSRWLMKRLDEIKASITSHFGSIFKLDSTKKVVRKFGGPCTGTAMWFTNVGNEYGQVIMSVLTTYEGYGLQDMAKGLVRRYSDAGMTSPVLLYVDWDCCGSSSVRRVFADWPDLQLRLDIWHFMGRISTGCTTDSHMLYAMFMGRLSHCIFKWDQSDLTQVKKAKTNELAAEHIMNPSDADVMNRLKRNQLALHCRRTTRGVQETTTLITQLIEAFDGDKGRDTFGVPLINSARMREIWKIQKSMWPASRILLVPSSTFRLGTLANATQYQAYIVDGLARWNQDRAKAATVNTSEQPSLQHQHSYSGLLRHTANKLSEEVLGHALTRYTAPRKYTGELIGLEYLYSQKDIIMHDYGAIIEEMESSTDDPTEDDVEEMDEGFADTSFENTDDSVYTIPNSSVYIWTAPSDHPLQHLPSAPPNAQPEPVEPDNIAGYDRVMDLAAYHVSLRDDSMALKSGEADYIIELWEALSDYDRLRSKFPARHRSYQIKDRFKSTKTAVSPGVESTRRYVYYGEMCDETMCSRHNRASSYTQVWTGGYLKCVIRRCVHDTIGHHHLPEYGQEDP
ncbi:hypothetical protein KP79_PYT01219 [Mizuhopecten yessoensis]|uniref:Uncharacterized protein n=1 Tax=Mizuhopecten yessoensis TaxID=6573 RepID=A0A210QHH0_MIZYE|nr:hypothetical protein KP79_PYT01219 [Mizuhopecten yessoensis]